MARVANFYCSSRKRIFYAISLVCAAVLFSYNWSIIDYQRYNYEFWQRKVEEYRRSQHFNSTCSWNADQRGSHQKILGYSIYGELSKDTKFASRYLTCFKHTLGIIPRAYPGWVVRIYHNLTRENEEDLRIFKNILPPDYEGYIDLCNATDIIKRRKMIELTPMTWRWLPLLDDMVDMFMSRDADSPLLPREEAAVHEWLESNITFHIMRDHPLHCLPMIGGLWGVKISQNRTVINKVTERIFMKRQHLPYYGHDQRLLASEMWQIASHNMMAHDSFCCGAFRPNRPFPTQRDGNKYVGMAVGKGCGADMKFKEKLRECPQHCRPKNHSSDWRYC